MDDSGLYFSAAGGIALYSEIGKAKTGFWFEKDGEEFHYDGTTRKDGRPTLREADLDQSFDIGWAVDAALGYRFGAFRAEAEGAYFSASPSKIGSAELDKDLFDTLPSLSVLAIMANGWYDFDTGTMFVPFVSLGLGAFNGSLSSGAPKNAPSDFEATVSSAWGFAYQGSAGVAMELGGGLSLNLAYRLFGTLEATYTTEVDSALGAGLPETPDKVIAATAYPLLAHRIELGLSFSF